MAGKRLKQNVLAGNRRNRQFRYLYIDKQTTRELKEVVNLYDGYSYRKLRSSLD